jgi:hypothetical protein
LLLQQPKFGFVLTGFLLLKRYFLTGAVFEIPGKKGDNEYKRRTEKMDYVITRRRIIGELKRLDTTGKPHATRY